MQKLFPVQNQDIQENPTQSRLMVIAALAMVTYATILTLSPAARYHAGSERYTLIHWIGVVVWFTAFSLLHRLSQKKLSNHDPYILPVAAMLSGIGLLTIWRLFPNLGLRQTIWLALSALVVYCGFQFPKFLGYLRRYKYIWLILGLTLTALTIFLGSNPSGTGPTLWLSIFGIQFQPSEPLKLLLIIFLASYFADRLTVIEGKFSSLLPTLIVTAIALLLLIFQRDLGTATIFLLLYLAIVFTTRGSKLVFWLTPVLILAAGAVGYLLTDIVKFRIDTWLNPFSDPSGASYQIIQSIIAIAEGRILGTGPGLGSPSLIPIAVSDFIFSAIAEELGFLGATFIILLIIILLYRGAKLAVASKNSFHRHLALGVVFYFGIQSAMIIGGNLGLFPLTGVTLPFVSYGGSSLLVSFSALLILMTISHHNHSLADEISVYRIRSVLISSMVIAVLLVEIVATSLISFWFMPSLIARPENPRWIVEDRFTARGNILDRDNQVIITNSGERGSFQRVSNHVPLYPVVGYTNATYGQTGIEASMFEYLRGYQGYPYTTRFWFDLVYNQPPEGLDIRLTIDLDLQQTADDLLEGSTGTAIIMNANSGEILAMASHPYFNAANLEEEWPNLINNEDAPLVNRATQGQYPPGSTLFPFIVAAQINLVQQYPDPVNLLLNLPKNLACAKSPGDELTWQSLMINGCQIPQAELAKLTGVETLLNIYRSFGFFSAPSLYLSVADASQVEIENERDFYLGEDSFTISPLQMALAVSALTNQGIMPGPRIVNAYRDSENNWITVPKFTNNTEVLPSTTANQVVNLLQTPNSPSWQVLSSLATDSEERFSWFLAGTTPIWQGQPISVVVVLEDGPPDLAQNIGNSLMEAAIRFSTQAP